MRPGFRAAGIAALLAGGWIASSVSVPLYDGVGFPDEPYRYVEAPAHAKHGPKPVQAWAMSPVAGGHNTNELGLQSDEQGPQILLDLRPGMVSAPPSAKTVMVTATPQAPKTQPGDGTIDGNVYRIAVASDAGPGSFAQIAGQADLFMRAASLQPAPPVMEYRDGTSNTWTALHTVRGGNDVFVVAFRGAGEYALVHQHGAHSSSGINQGNLLLILLVGFVLLVIIGAVAARRPWQDRGEAGSSGD